jgi:hypothetical protein
MADDPRLELPSLRPRFGRRAKPEIAESAHHDTEITPSRLMTTRRTTPAPVEDPTPEAEVRRPRRRMRMHLPGPLASVVTGLLAGLALVGLTAGALHACSSMHGTSSCGKPGILLLLAITAIVILLGSLLLRLLGVAAAGSTSFLGVGIAVVVILLALASVLDQSWVVIVVPTLTMLTYLAAWWLTTAYAAPADRPD